MPIDEDEVLLKMTAIAWTYADKDQSALEILEQRIADTARRRRLISYSDFVEGVPFHLPNIHGGEAYYIRTYDWSGLDRQIVGEFLGYISVRSFKKVRFMASAIVVDKINGKPSEHFFAWLRKLDVLPNRSERTIERFWSDEIRKVQEWYARH